MAAFTLTASGVKAGSGAKIEIVSSSEASNAGQAITNNGYVVDPNDSNKFSILGLSVSGASATGSSVVVTDGDVEVSDSLTPQRQIIAAPSGQLQYDDDLLSGDEYIIVGYTKDANTITVKSPRDTGVFKA